jgi:bacteriocin-like protein
MKILHDDQLNSISGGVILMEVDENLASSGNGVAKGGVKAFSALYEAANKREGGLGIEMEFVGTWEDLHLLTRIVTP